MGLSGAAIVIIALVAVARWPVTTAVGSNYQVILKEITLLEKTVAFVDRDLQMRRLTGEIAGTSGTPEQRVLRMYAWVTDNIHPVPPGLPVIDDHIWNIFVRRYGEPDQRAEALAVLASYDGMPASALPLGKEPHTRPVQLTVVRLGDRILVFDVNMRIVFRKPSGELATLPDLQADPSLIQTNGTGLMVAGVPYEEHFVQLKAYDPTFVRMEKQRLLPRLRAEFLEYLSGSK